MVDSFLAKFLYIVESKCIQMQGWMGRVEDVYNIKVLALPPEAQERLISLKIETLDGRTSQCIKCKS